MATISAVFKSRFKSNKINKNKCVNKSIFISIPILIAMNWNKMVKDIFNQNKHQSVCHHNGDPNPILVFV